MGSDSLADSQTCQGAVIRFRKMHGLGNDFVVIDQRKLPRAFSRAEFARIADRRFGIGCDQVIILEPSAKADIRMRIFNPDGGEVGACGNATRCIGRLVADEAGRADVSIETLAGVLSARTGEGDMVAVNMGHPRLGWAEIPLSGPALDTARVPIDAAAIDPRLPGWFSAVNMGNPHAVFFVEDGEIFDLGRIGPMLEAHPRFPEKANISLAMPLGRNRFRVRVWERAAGATLACGTAACAVAVAAARLDLASGAMRIDLPGGALMISRLADGAVVMTGPMATSFSGAIAPSLLDAGPALAAEAAE